MYLEISLYFPAVSCQQITCATYTHRDQEQLNFGLFQLLF